MNRTRTILLLAAIVAGTLARFWDLDRREIWFDEAISIDVAVRADFADLSSFVDDNKPPLYLLLLRGWIEIFGASESGVRSLSAVCGLLAIAVVWLFARELLGEECALIGAWLFALNPLAIHYAREARNYSLLMLLLTASCWLLERALRGPHRIRRWLLYALALGATIFTHYHAGIVVVVHLLQVASHRPMELKRWCVAVGLVGAAYVPWIPVFLRQLAQVPQGLSWLTPFWREYPPALAIPRSLLAFSPGGAVPRFVGMESHATLQPLVALACALALGLALFPSREAALEPRRDRAVVILSAAVLVPLLAIWVLSFLMVPLYAVGRTDTHVLPLFCILVAAGVVRLKSVAARGLLSGVVIVLGLVTVATAGRVAENEERKLFGELRSMLREGDLVICAGYSGPSTAYYLEHLPPRSGVVVRHYPENFSGNPRIGDPDAFSAQFLDAESEDAAWQAERILARGRRVLVFGTRSPANAWLVRALGKRLRVERRPVLDYETSRNALPVFGFEVVRN